MVQVSVKRKNDTLYHSDVYLGEDYSDGIYHWKYIKKEKKNGKFVYYYDNATDSNYKNNREQWSKTHTYDPKTENVKKSQKLTKYKDTNKLFSKSYREKKTDTDKILGVKLETKYTQVTKERGKIERFIAKGEKWLFDKFFKNK